MSLSAAHETRQALGGDTTVVLTLAKGQQAAPIFAKIWQYVFGFERQFSRFVPESELSQLNRKAGIAVPVSAEFSALLARSAELSRRTGGLYNPFMLPAVQRAGYTHSALPGYEHDTFEDYRAHTVVTADQLTLANGHATIPYGTAIDMGGCGKGYLADQLADYLDGLDLPGYWVSLSGDIAVRGINEHNQSWDITIQAARDSNDPLPTLSNDSRRFGIATSGTFRRSNQPELKKHHLIDPRTGAPADSDILLATVVCKEAVVADVLATCAVILGSKKAVDFLADQSVEAFVLQTTSGIQQFGSLLQEQSSEAAHV